MMNYPHGEERYQNISWSIYRIRGTPAVLVGIVYAPDEKTAIQMAIEEYQIILDRCPTLPREGGELLISAGIQTRPSRREFHDVLHATISSWVILRVQ
jgi:hypothetical protein